MRENARANGGRGAERRLRNEERIVLWRRMSQCTVQRITPEHALLKAEGVKVWRTGVYGGWKWGVDIEVKKRCWIDLPRARAR